MCQSLTCVLLVHAYNGKPVELLDLDPVVMTDKPLSLLQLIDLKEDFSNSDLSFKVDLVDWGATSEDFKKVIEKQAVLIHKGNSK